MKASALTFGGLRFETPVRLLPIECVTIGFLRDTGRAALRASRAEEARNAPMYAAARRRHARIAFAAAAVVVLRARGIQRPSHRRRTAP